LSFASKPKNTDETRVNAPKIEATDKKRPLTEISCLENDQENPKVESPNKKLKI
jgi:hypothetical protein